MIPTLLSALLIAFCALMLGQAALRLCGATRWSWLAPPVGVSILIILAVPALHTPGRSTTVAVIIALLAISALIWCVREPAHLPPISGLAAGIPIALLTLVPFVVAGHAGILGVAFNNDTAAHMLLAEAYRSQTVAHITPILPAYPLGPHALVAALAQGSHIHIDRVFVGLTMAAPILIGWTSLLALKRPSLFRQIVTATVVGMPFLVAAYYGQGAFKEILQALFVLAVAFVLAGYGPVMGGLRWVPVALLLAGILSVYSIPGLVWPFAFFCVWIVGLAAVRVYRGNVRAACKEISSELLGVAIGAGVLAIVIIPQLPRLTKFDTGLIKPNDFGNLAGPISGWEAFGVWTNPDFRFAPASAFTAEVLTAFVFFLVIVGAVWALKSGKWMLVAAAATSMLIWAASAGTQSPYVAVKALVIASPLLLLLAALPLVTHSTTMHEWQRKVAPLLALGLFASVVLSSFGALRYSSVGPTDHLDELRALRSEIHGKPALFLGNDDFIRWELSWVPISAPIIGFQKLPIRPEKEWAYGKALDFDSVDAATLNANDWVITTRDAAGSDAPPQLQLVRSTPSYELWRRRGQIEPRKILAEGDEAGAVLNCKSKAGRALVKRGGVAAVRKPSVSVPVGPIAPGGNVKSHVKLGTGKWDLNASYESPLPIEVIAPGLRATLPANKDRPGPRWPIGRIVVRTAGNVTVTFHATKKWLTHALTVVNVAAVVATPVGTERIVPLRSACGKYVDWYR